MTYTLINPTAQAAVDTLHKAFGKRVEPGKAALKSTEIPLGDITAMIEVASEHFHGSLAIACNEQSILSFTQVLINETHLNINETVANIAGDVAVMVGGGIKRRFSDLGVSVSLKHPRVLVGYNHKIQHPLPGVKVVFPLNTEDGIIFLETCFHSFKADPIHQPNNVMAA